MCYHTRLIIYFIKNAYLTELLYRALHVKSLNFEKWLEEKEDINFFKALSMCQDLLDFMLEV
jgi:hypothetical protein